MAKKLWLAAVLLLVFVAVSRPAAPLPPAAADLKSPAGSGSAEPNLAAAPDGRVFMTWIEPAAGTGKGSVLYVSVLQGNAWSAPKVIARGTNWFVNPADFPSIVVMLDGTLAAHWLVSNDGPEAEVYDVDLSFSKDGGVSWTKPVVPHRDRKKRQHGFVSLTPLPDGKLAAVWLDGRNMADEDHGDMALMYTTITPAGVLGTESQIDSRVCECCKTAMAVTPDGLIAVYRDRSDKEIRDISVSRYANGRWSAPQDLTKDGWKIEGCPINGPAVSSSGKNVAVAWFTAPLEKAQVNLMMSSDGGKTFGPKIRIDEGNPAGRVEVLSPASGGAIVSWVERTQGNGPQLHLRQIDANGKVAAVVNVSAAARVASGGFPKMAASGKGIVVAWTDSGDPSRVHTTVVNP
ncbi:MAG TPA: sialidase family protein [Terriglobia bacterium]|jgi:hypothetical protein